MTDIKSDSVQQAAEQVLVITRVFESPRSLVFKAWTEPEHVMQWWGPKGFTCPVCEIDLRPGGVYFNCMRASEGQDYWSRGVYQEISEPQRIVCSDTFADENGNTVSPQQYGMSPDWPAEAMIEITFAEQGEETRLTLRHWPIKPGRERDMCLQGWNESLDKLADYLANAMKAEDM